MWTKERLLRGVLRPVQAITLATGSSLILLLLTWQAQKAEAALGIAIGPLVVAAVIDARRYLLPDPLLLISLSLLIGIRLFLACVHCDPRTLVYPLGIGGLVYLVLAQVSHRTSMGMGDAKLLGILGIWIADERLFLVALSASLIALFQSAHVAHHRGWTCRIPLGPALVASALFFWLWDLAILP